MINIKVKKKSIITSFIIFIAIFIGICLFYYLHYAYYFSTPKDSLKEFNELDMPAIISQFKKLISFDDNKIKSKDYIIFAYFPMLVDSLNCIYLHNYVDGKTSYAGFKICWNNVEKRVDNVGFWNIKIGIKNDKEIDFNKMKFLHGYSLMPMVVDGVIYAVYYDNRCMTFSNPSFGISPFDILLSKVILKNSFENQKANEINNYFEKCKNSQ